MPDVALERVDGNVLCLLQVQLAFLTHLALPNVFHPGAQDPPDGAQL